MTPGKFIVIEGLEGAGKSSAVAAIETLLKRRGIRFINTREPGGTPLAEGGSTGGKGKGKNKDTSPDPEPTPEPDPDPIPDPTPEPEPSTGTYATSDYVSNAANPDAFNIQANFIGNWSDAHLDIVKSALEQISSMITGDLADVKLGFGWVDDLFIDVSLVTIDGSGGYGGWGGYYQTRADGSPSYGYARIDEADVNMLANNGILDDFIIHEAFHTLGFGVAWASQGLTETINGQLRFTGANAIEAYNTEYASIAANDADSWLGVPVEMDGGSGTAGLHWDEALFGNELMTGWAGWTNTISDMTLASLEDLGYQTTYGDDLAFV